MIDKNYKDLACAIANQGIRDYFTFKRESSKQEVLEDLESDWMDFITNGLSVKAAEELKRNPKEVAKRIKLYKQTYRGRN